MDDRELEERLGIGGQWDEIFTYEIDPDESYSMAVVSAVSAVEGVETHCLPELLYDRVNPDALDSFAFVDQITDPSEFSLSFPFCGYSVTVFPDVVIVISEGDAECL